MGFAAIGSWIDNKLDQAGTSWRGSQAKKVVDDLMERSKNATGEVREQFDQAYYTAQDNLDAGLTKIEKDNPDAGMMKKLLEVGKRGGFIGLAMKGADGHVQETPAQKPPVQLELFPETKGDPGGKKAFVATNMKPMEDVGGWKIA
jgi:hypothetical protein